MEIELATAVVTVVKSRPGMKVQGPAAMVPMTSYWHTSKCNLTPAARRRKISPNSFLLALEPIEESESPESVKKSSLPDQLGSRRSSPDRLGCQFLHTLPATLETRMAGARNSTLKN
jgi:hypothetical protein